MVQQSYFDKSVLCKISNEDIVVDKENGFIYGKRKNLKGERSIIGCKIKGEYFVTFVKEDGRTINYPIRRVIYLAEHLEITNGHEVYWVNENPLDNRAINLKTRQVKEKKRVSHWSDDEIDFLINNYKSMSYDELSLSLKRSVKAIRHKLKNIKLKKKSKKRIWTSEDDKRLASLYQQSSLSIDDIAKKMGKNKNSVRLRANRINNVHRSDSHLRDNLNENNFYTSAKLAFQRGTLRMECCLCGYDKYVELHHIDGDRRNNHISNIATLCPNHHSAVTHGEHQKELFYAIWQRKYKDGKLGKLMKSNSIKTTNISGAGSDS